MIIRRRRTRIEIEQTTVRLEVGASDHFATPAAPSSAAPALAGVPGFPAPGPNNPAIGSKGSPVAATPDRETLLTTPQEKHS